MAVLPRSQSVRFSWQREKHRNAQQLKASLNGAQDLKAQLAQAETERDQWKYAAEAARNNALQEVANLLCYDGSERGQYDIKQ